MTETFPETDPLPADHDQRARRPIVEVGIEGDVPREPQHDTSDLVGGELALGFDLPEVDLAVDQATVHASTRRAFTGSSAARRK